MLLLCFNIGKKRFAIPSQTILEIIPLVPIDKVPQVDPAISGIIQYRGVTLPIIDLVMFLNKKNSKRLLSSRIIICQLNVNNTSQMLGFIAEHVTETISYDENDLEDNGITDKKTHFLSAIYRHQEQTIQIINIENLLPKSIQSNISKTQT